MSAGTAAQALRLYVERAVAWRRATPDRGVLTAIATVGFSGVFIKLAALWKDVLVASYFGTSDAVDAFLIALAIPTFVMSIVTSALPAALLPPYVRIRLREGPEAAADLLTPVLLTAGGVVLLLALLLLVSGPALTSLVGADFDAEKQGLTQRLFAPMLFGLAATSLATVVASILNAHGAFALPSITPVLVPLGTAALLLMAGRRWGIYVLPAGLVVGSVLELLLLGWWVRRHGLVRMPTRSRIHPAVREVWTQYSPTVIGVAVMGTSTLIDQAMAARLGPGAVAQLGYGSKIVAALLGVGSSAMSSAIFPRFASLIAAGAWSGVRRTLALYSRLTLLAIVPVTVALVLFSEPLVRLLFERGAFTSADTRAVATVQALFALQMPFFLLGIIGVRLVAAMGGGRVLMWVSIGNFVTNIVGNLILMRVWGVAGIALSTSVVYMLSSAAAFAYIFRKLRRLAPPS